MQKVYDAMVVLEQPMTIETNVIYGLVYNTEKEYSEYDCYYLNFYDRIDIYLAYMCALSRFLQEGGRVSLDKNTWTYPDGRMINLRDEGVKEEITKQFIGQVRYTVLEYSKSLELEEGDIDEDLIINPAVIEKYSISNHIRKGGHV